METDKLRKLAALLRHEAKKIDSTKQEKLASITLAAAGLELLRRKLK
tara:strand:- start:2659 stop:2799 length:141 start_codon:yes stop_codon:yes gene_type:complete